jgi:HD-GYP domain-containing protein (c-di-GMP phosphodiesterase class II)
VSTAVLSPRLKSTPRRFTTAEQANALSVILRKEFGIPFVFYHATTGQSVHDHPMRAGDCGLRNGADHPPVAIRSPQLALAALPPEEVVRLASDTQPEVTVLADGRYQLTMVFYDGSKPLVVAAGLFVGLAKTRADSDREQTWLRQWLQSVSDRLRLAEQCQRHKRTTDDRHEQAKTAWEGLLALDHVLRRLRIHKDPVRNRQRILERAHGLLGAQTLAWVPLDTTPPVQMAGEPCLSQIDCRNLAELLRKNPDMEANGHLLQNEVQGTPWGSSFPSLHSLLAFHLKDADAPSCVLALNKKPLVGQDSDPDKPRQDRNPDPRCGFRRGDAALLTPFVALLRLHIAASGRYRDLKDLMVGMARSLTSAIDAKDSYTFGHSERVARIGVELGRTLGLEGDDLSDIYLSGLLHDVGKIGIRDDVLRKVDPLTPDEFEHIKQHVTIGYTILADLKPIRNLLPGVLYHHERWDGKGYPDGLAGEAIPLLARILAVADAYDAMSTCRPYREALPIREVEDRLARGAGTQWDAKVVDAFTRCRQKVHAIRQRGVGESLRTALDAALRSVELGSSVVG